MVSWLDRCWQAFGLVACNRRLRVGRGLGFGFTHFPIGIQPSVLHYFHHLTVLALVFGFLLSSASFTLASSPRLCVAGFYTALFWFCRLWFFWQASASYLFHYCFGFGLLTRGLQSALVSLGLLLFSGQPSLRSCIHLYSSSALVLLLSFGFITLSSTSTLVLASSLRSTPCSSSCGKFMVPLNVGSLVWFYWFRLCSSSLRSFAFLFTSLQFHTLSRPSSRFSFIPLLLLSVCFTRHFLRLHLLLEGGFGFRISARF